jgi:hydroxypyruvate isomerase
VEWFFHIPEQRRKPTMPSPRRYAVNLSILFTEVPFLERPQAAADAGFDAVECWWPWPDTATPSTEDVDAFVSAIENAGVQLIGLNFFAGDMAGGDRGLFAWPEREADIRANIPVVAEIGKRLGCKAFNALYGNRIEGGDDAAADALATELLAEAGKAVAADGGTILIEPVSGTPAYPLKTAADAIAVVDRVKEETGVDNLGFLCDLYHLAANGDDVDAAVETYGPRSAHVQIADNPGRGEPGTGELPLDRWLDELAAQGYDGYVALEYKTTSTTTDGLDAWLPRADRSSKK